MIANLRAMLSRAWGTLLRRRLDQDLEEEVQEHLDMLVERFIHQGMSPEEARCAARRQFGGVTQLKEDVHERRSLPQIEVLCRDIRYALRQLWNAPAFT